MHILYGVTTAFRHFTFDHRSYCQRFGSPADSSSPRAMISRAMKFYDMIRLCTWSAFMGFQPSLGPSWEVLGDHQGSLVVRWVSLWGTLGVPLDPWKVPGGPWEGARREQSPKGFLGVSGGACWALGVILVVWGGPWVRPRGCKC